MILPMILKVWQVLAETASLAKMAFGETHSSAYVEFAAGTCVTNLLKVYTNNTLPLLLGLVAPRPGPFFIVSQELRTLSLSFIHYSPPIAVGAPTRTA